MYVKLDKDVKEKIVIARQYLLRNELDIGHRLLILQVFSGIKPAASFDYVDKEEEPKIIATLKAMGMYFRVIERKEATKIIFGKKANIDRMNKIHDSVFTSSPESLMVMEYGKLLGYPSCCISPDLAPNTKKTNVLFNRFSGTPLIFHFTCSDNCEKSIELAKKVLAAYFFFDKDIFASVVAELKKPILKFSENLFAKFDGYSVTGNRIRYGSVDISVVSPIDEQEKCKEDADFLEQLRKGDSVSFFKNSLKIFKGENLITERKFANDTFEILNI